MVSEPYKSLGTIGLGFRHVINSGDPSNNYVSFQSCYSRHKASQEPQPSLEHPTASNFFRRPQLQHVDTPPRSLEPALPTGGRISDNRYPTRRHAQFSLPPLPLTHRSVRAHGFFYSRRTSPPESPAANLQA